MDLQKSKKFQYLDSYLKVWRMVSMGPRNGSHPLYYWTVLVIVTIANTLLLIFMYRHIVIHSRDIDGVAEIVDFATLFTSGMFRYVHAFVNRRRYTRIVDYVRENFATESFGDAKFTVDRTIKISNYVNITYTVLSLMWLIQSSCARYFFASANGGPNRFTIFIVDLPYDEDTPQKIAFTYVIHYINYVCIVFAYCLCDSFWFSILMLTNCQFEMISHSLRTLAEGEAAGMLEESDDECRKMQNVLKSCLKHHQMLRRCNRMIEELLCGIVLVDFLHAMISITFLLFDMTVAFNSGYWMKVLNLLGYFFLSVIHMWVVDYFGNLVYNKEEEISNAVYNIPWYKYPSKFKTEIILMTGLANHPYKLTGGKFFSLSLEFYGKSMRTILSYFTVLLQLRES